MEKQVGAEKEEENIGSPPILMREGPDGKATGNLKLQESRAWVETYTHFFPELVWIQFTRKSHERERLGNECPTFKGKSHPSTQLKDSRNQNRSLRQTHCLFLGNMC